MASEKFVLVTGGAGYIGSHTVLVMLNSEGYIPVVIDNMVNASYGDKHGSNDFQLPESLRRVQDITKKKVHFHEADLLDKASLQALFKKYNFQLVIHFAALKAVGESVKVPLLYYQANIIGAINLLQVVNQLILKLYK
jgi:UDP-glucose 4-epimerase